MKTYKYNTQNKRSFYIGCKDANLYMKENNQSKHKSVDMREKWSRSDIKNKEGMKDAQDIHPCGDKEILTRSCKNQKF